LRIDDGLLIRPRSESRQAVRCSDQSRCKPNADATVLEEVGLKKIHLLDSFFMPPLEQSALS
jgi:hypothetical protein